MFLFGIKIKAQGPLTMKKKKFRVCFFSTINVIK